MSKAKLKRAQKLIEQKRYDAARLVLEQIPDDPTAQRWLAKLVGKADAPPKNQLLTGQQMVLGIGFIVMTTAVMLFLFVALPRFIQVSQPSIQDIENLANAPLTDEEILYYGLIAYCTPFVGYGAEACLDWADMVIVDYHAQAEQCIQVGEPETDEGRALIYQCFSEQGVPAPF